MRFRIIHKHTKRFRFYTQITYKFNKDPLNNFCFTILTVNIPHEILYWNLEDRKKFIRSMKAGDISVYNGRAMVIGCAYAGNTTLVKKIKGDSDLETTSTSGIEIHSHAFKLNSDESTVIGKYVHFLYYCFQSSHIKHFLYMAFVCLFLQEGNSNSHIYSMSNFSINRILTLFSIC